MSHVTVSGVWERRETVSHITVSGGWRAKGQGVTCNGFWGLGEMGKGVTCNGFWGLEGEVALHCSALHCYVVGAVVLVVVVVCVGLWGVLDGRGGQPRCAHSAPCREDSLQQPLQKAGSWTAYPFRRLLVVAVVAAGGRYLRRRVVSVS